MQKSEQKSVQKSDPVWEIFRGKSVYQNKKSTLCLLVPGLCSEPLKLKDAQTVPSIGRGQDEQILFFETFFLLEIKIRV